MAVAKADPPAGVRVLADEAGGSGFLGAAIDRDVPR